MREIKQPGASQSSMWCVCPSRTSRRAVKTGPVLKPRSKGNQKHTKPSQIHDVNPLVWAHLIGSQDRSLKQGLEDSKGEEDVCVWMWSLISCTLRNVKEESKSAPNCSFDIDLVPASVFLWEEIKVRQQQSTLMEISSELLSPAPMMEEILRSAEVNKSKASRKELLLSGGRREHIGVPVGCSSSYCSTRGVGPLGCGTLRISLA